MKHTLIPLVFLSLAPMLVSQVIEFAQSDANADGFVELDELQNANLEALDQADEDIDRRLSEKEFTAYQRAVKSLSEAKQNIPDGIRAIFDIPYVGNGHYRQKLDVYLPAETGKAAPLPLVIWIHGGGWRKGNKLNIPRQLSLIEQGFAVASINYRLSHHATFPAQIHDCKAAIRYLRKHAADYGLDPTRFGVWGSSAGGHLVALVGTSGDVRRLEGNLGATDASSRVQAVCDFFGPTDFTKLANRPPNPNIKSTDPLMQPIPRLLGGTVQDKPKLAKQASPVTYVSSDDPPFLIMQGNADPLVPWQQSQLLHQLLERAGVDSTLVIVDGAGHGFFKEPHQLELVQEFFKQHLIK